MPLRRYYQSLRSFDWVLFGAVVLLFLFGLAALYSIAISSDQPDFLNFRKQLVFGLIGFAVCAAAVMFDYRVWESYAGWFYGVACALLVGVLFFGRTIRGTTGWFSLAGFTFQPVELAKIALIALLAWLISRRPEGSTRLSTFALSGLIAAVLFGLVIGQPDFGSGILLLGTWLGLSILSGANWKFIAPLAIAAVVAGLVAWFFLFAPYQKDRILAFFDPQNDPYGRGYHVRQAVTAVGAGGLLGRGLGFGSQSQLKFIPASETDFIFAVIAEELGFFGVALVLSFWAIIFYRLWRASRSIRDGFALYFIVGVSILFFLHLVINVGMNIGLVPVTGISLPFMSYGGSFLVTSLALIGLVEGMIMRSRVS